MERILVVRLGSLGDLVHTVPAVSAIRRAHPDATIDWLVDAVHAPFLACVPAITSVVTLRSRTAGGWLSVRRELRQRQYDVALDFQGLIKSAALARLSGAKRVIGFKREALREPLARVFYTQQIDVVSGRHVVEKNLALARAVLPSSWPAEAMQFPLAVSGSRVPAAVREGGIAAFMLMNPGAAWPNKRWPPERFAAVADSVWVRHRIRSLVLWGPGECELAERVVAASHDGAVLAPATDIADIVALGRDARLVLSGDTGPLHLALAAGAPGVGLYGPTNPARNGPWAPADISISRYHRCACHYHRVCTRSGEPCINEIMVDEVIAAIDQRLAAAGTRAAGAAQA